ncbi:putative bifunctional diguanylate cyclase/phosphodiesterase [Roseisalinus antarcticus]|uniref:Cyclic di-GMP phosphodiesterase Gmr n=1 Tax=Roseisalinus antarcticus TaxID=254357 RepID=A0A1Y5SB33_9RHOB|nr:EAL domain-containing protein [Roseisalinus antarcticus]SLN35506.1 Cyclic di-GMP phosphodiesterase Gmr [Roseisalinus antarcticus]
MMLVDPENWTIQVISAGLRTRLRTARPDLGPDASLRLLDVAPDLAAPHVLGSLGALTRTPGKTLHVQSRLGSDDEAIPPITLRAEATGDDPPRLLIVANDATPLLSAMADAQIARDQLRCAVEALPDGFVLFDADDRLVLCNTRYREIYPESAEALLVGARFEETLRHGLERGQCDTTPGRQEAWLAKRLAAHRSAHSQFEQKLADGRWIRIIEEQTRDGGRVGLRIDVTAQKERERALFIAAQTDPLTGLLNRRGLGEAMAAIQSTATSADRLSVMHIDLDKFKSVNDMLGHDAGDFVLTHCAEILRQETRETDIVARVGGDEFVVLYHDAGVERDLSEMAERLVKCLSEPILFNGKTCHVGASIGIAVWHPTGDQTGHGPLLDADIALKCAKDGGRGRHAFFRSEMRDVARQAAQISHEIVDGLERSEFRIWLQPQFDITGRNVSGFEALMRWHHPERGMIGPSEFLQAAEQASLIDALDREVLRLGCTAARRLIDIGADAPRVSINLSTSRLSDPRLIDTINWSLQANRLGPENIVLEILESTLLDDRAVNVVENVHRLSRAGFTIELDDFGTGHAAIANLRRFPVDRVKIDKSLVQGIERDGELRIITTSIMALCKGLGIDVLCEGVQNEAERRFLQGAGCKSVQGFVFARPMPLDDLEVWLADRPGWGD